MPRRISATVTACLLLSAGGVLDAAVSQDRQHALHRELAQAIEPQADNSHLERLAALRALHDPRLQPLFQAMCLHSDPAMQLHGILGLGELTPSGRPDPLRLAALPPAIRVQALAVALDQDLLAPEDIRALLEVDGLTPETRVNLLTALAHTGEDLTAEELDGAEATTNHPMALAAHAALSARAGSPGLLEDLPATLAALPRAARHDAYLKALETIHQAPDPAGLTFAQAMLDPDLPDGLRRYAVLVLCAHDDPRAPAAVADEFRRAQRQRARVDLALVLLMTESPVPAGLKAELADDDLLAPMGRVADALAHNDPEAPRHITALANTGHRRSIAWILDAAPEWPRETAVEVLTALIHTALSDPARMQTDLATAAAATLRQVDVTAFAEHLRAAPDDSPQQTAFLVALLQSPAPEIVDHVASLRRIGLDTADMLTLLILARDGQALEADDVERLALIASGGGASNAIRTQAAWLALRHGADVQVELTQLLDRP